MSLILIVDDSRFARGTMRRVLTDMGHTVDEACSGAEALERYSEKRHDLVTLDLLMPNMDGLDALAKLREINPEVKVIVATADIQDSTREQVLSFGNAALVNKPMAPEQLRGVIATLLAEEAPCT